MAYFILRRQPPPCKYPILKSMNANTNDLYDMNPDNYNQTKRFSRWHLIFEEWSQTKTTARPFGSCYNQISIKMKEWIKDSEMLSSQKINSHQKRGDGSHRWSWHTRRGKPDWRSYYLGLKRPILLLTSSPTNILFLVIDLIFFQYQILNPLKVRILFSFTVEILIHKTKQTVMEGTNQTYWMTTI